MNVKLLVLFSMANATFGLLKLLLVLCGWSVINTARVSKLLKTVDELPSFTFDWITTLLLAPKTPSTAFNMFSVMTSV